MIESFETNDLAFAEYSAERLRELLAERLDRARADDHARRLASTAPLDLTSLIANAASPDILAAELRAISLTPVLTSHPSEMRSARALFALATCDDAETAYARLRETNDRVNLQRPTIADEVDALLGHFRRNIFNAVGEFYDELESLVRDRFGDAAPPIPTMLRFHSWVGCDRDGNPECTAAATLETAAAMHRCIVECYRTELTQLASGVESDDLRTELASLADALDISGTVCDLPGDEFETRLRQISERDSEATVRLVLHRLLRLYATFGFHLATLEWRQHSDFILFAFDEREKAVRPTQMRVHEMAPPQRLSRATGALRASVDASEYEHLLTSAKSVELMNSLRALATIRASYGPAAVGELIISNCEDVVAIFALECLARDAGVYARGELQLVPLFETLTALGNGPKIVAEALLEPEFRDKIGRLDGTFEIMLGYSDAAKDGGRIAADMLIRKAQREIYTVCETNAVVPRIFHGRGGSYGRGVASVADAMRIVDVRARPAETKVTEQGEIVANRYGHPRFAAHTVRSWFRAALTTLRTARDVAQPDAEWAALVDEIAAQGSIAFRRLRESTGFMEAVRATTALDIVRGFPLSSRPASRSEEKHTRIELSALRAVPFNISFNVAFAQVPAWYGTGSGLAAALSYVPLNVLRSAYAHDMLFRLSIDTARSALERTNLRVLRGRCRNDNELAFFVRIADEEVLTRSLISLIVQADVPEYAACVDDRCVGEIVRLLQERGDHLDEHNSYLALATIAATIGMTG